MLPKCHPQHLYCEIYSENVVAVGEEAYTSNRHRPNMIPSEWSLVYFRQGKPPPLVGLCDMTEVVGEVVKSSIASSGAEYPLLLLWVGLWPHQEDGGVGQALKAAVKSRQALKAVEKNQ